MLYIKTWGCFDTQHPHVFYIDYGSFIYKNGHLMSIGDDRLQLSVSNILIINVPIFEVFSLDDALSKSGIEHGLNSDFGRTRRESVSPE